MTAQVSYPGIVLAISGYRLANKRLASAGKAHRESPSPTTRANFVRAGCESLFWLFALNEDFDSLIEAKAGVKIHDWWAKQGNHGKIMNALRFARNRITHEYKYYWEMWDLSDLTWSKVEGPTPEERSGPARRYVDDQHADYQAVLEGKDVEKTLEPIASVIVHEAMKYDLKDW